MQSELLRGQQQLSGHSGSGRQSASGAWLTQRKPAKVWKCSTRTGQPTRRGASSSYQGSGGGRGRPENASDRFRTGAEEVGNRFRKTASNVDSKFDLSGKAHKAATKVREQAQAVDSKFGVRHRLRSISDDFQRQLPRRVKQYQQFSKTSFGQFVTTAFIVYLFASGLAFRLLNILFILWWLIPIIALPLARRRNQQKLVVTQAQQEAAKQRQQYGGGSIFEELFRNVQQQQQQQRQQGYRGSGPGSSGPGQGQGSWSSSSQSRGRDFGSMGDGPVIDAEWTTVDEDK